MLLNYLRLNNIGKEKSRFMKQSTLDILDASLRTDNNKYYSMSEEDRYALFTRKPVRIDPQKSDDIYPQINTANFTWSAPIKYSSFPDFKSLITSNQIGNYIMYVQPENTILGMPKYVLYVGISGENGSSRPLKERLNDYFYISGLKKRSNVHKLLQLYYKHVYIVYSLYNGSFSDLENDEKIFHEYYYPIYCDRDFSPETKKGRKAWN